MLRRDHNRRGFTLLELIVVFSICAVLAAITIPAIVAAREAARRTSCANNLRQLALGLACFHDTHRRYPPDNSGQSLRGWAYDVLPFVEEVGLHSLMYPDQPPDAPANLSVSTIERPRLLQCSSARYRYATTFGPPNVLGSDYCFNSWLCGKSVASADNASSLILLQEVPAIPELIQPWAASPAIPFVFDPMSHESNHVRALHVACVAGNVMLLTSPTDANMRPDETL